MSCALQYLGVAMFYVAIEGVIGVGKTTLARLLQAPLAAISLLEAVEENPFLSSFYSDRARYAFQTETFFLLSRYRQQQAVVRPARETSNLVSDYLFAKNYLFAGLNLAGDEWDLFRQLFSALEERVVRPDLVIYLQASVDTLMARIAQRDRPFERNMDRGYIAALHRAYESFFAGYDASRVLRIDTEGRDLVSDATAQREVIGLVRAALEGYEQQSFVATP